MSPEEHIQTTAQPAVIAVGGGKGGIGKTLLTANLGICFAKNKWRVVLVDADLGGSNLHTCLGVDFPELSLSDFVQRRVLAINDVIIETGIEGLRLISGAQDFLGSANIKYTQKLRGHFFQRPGLFPGFRPGVGGDGAGAHLPGEQLPVRQERFLPAAAPPREERAFPQDHRGGHAEPQREGHPHPL
jgi:hypothetical protein